MAPILEVADIFRRHGRAFRQAHTGHLGYVEHRIMGAITACRTAVLGGHVEQCDDCGATRIAYNSCRNRHCPKCQGLARAQWLVERQAELLPVPYFHVVFTLPASVGEIAFQNKATVYAILFRAAAETLATIAADPRHLGAKLGMTMVLHTWGQTLQHHPHVHCVVPGGGLDMARQGKRVYPLATHLEETNTPFAFVTGLRAEIHSCGEQFSRTWRHCQTNRPQGACSTCLYVARNSGTITSIRAVGHMLQ